MEGKIHEPAQKTQAKTKLPEFERMPLYGGGPPGCGREPCSTILYTGSASVLGIRVVTPFRQSRLSGRRDRPIMVTRNGLKLPRISHRLSAAYTYTGLLISR